MTRINRQRIVALIVLCVLLTSCFHRVHPGAVNLVDSQAYDTLLIAQAGLKEMRTALASGELPATILPAFNKAVDAYNAAQLTWQSYHGGLSRSDGDLRVKIADVVAKLAAAQIEAGRRP